jgi:hypothetical protein
MRATPVLLSLALLSACATPAATSRAEAWRAILAAEAPVGAPAAAVEQALARRGLTPARGTYVTVRDDGTRASTCPDPSAAVTGGEVAGRIGFNSNVVEITACLDGNGRVLSHHVGVWVQ